MKHTLTLYYSVQNGGDGSAYPKLMSSQELADYDQENMDEGWGENCTGTFNLESDSPIICKDKITRPENFLIHLIQEGSEEQINNFIAKFFPSGKPKFTVKTRIINIESCKDYLYNDVYIGKQKVEEVFLNKKESGQKFEDLLNK